MSYQATNTFEEGLMMDSSTLNTPSNVLTNALNATLLTRNGNELVLQNDMGNGRVESAFLPEGFIPLGTASLGGIIYIVSYNPLTNQSQIGSFPSPERNITTDELGESEKTFNGSDYYQKDDEGNITDIILFPRQKLILCDKELNPGDKFQIFTKVNGASDTIIRNSEIISAKDSEIFNYNDLPRYLKLKVVGIQENGTITDLTDTLVWKDGYYISDEVIGLGNDGKLNVDEYRDLIQSNYNVFNSKTSGKIGILAQLEAIDSFDVAWDAKKNNDQWEIYLFTNWTYDNDYEQSKNKINLYGIKWVTTQNGQPNTDNIIINNYPKSDYIESTNEEVVHPEKIIDGNIGDFEEQKRYVDNTDILQQPKNIKFYNPRFTENASKVLAYQGAEGVRKNDGTDNQFLITTPITLSENTSGVVDFTIYPGMPYGYLDYLKQRFQIDVDKLGSGQIDLIEYRYYCYDNKVTLNWGLEAYPEPNKKIISADFSFYKYDSDLRTFIVNNSNNIDESRCVSDFRGTYWEQDKDNKTKYNQDLDIKDKASVTYKATKSSYSGNHTEIIDGLEENSLYLVKIKINYNRDRQLIYYRFLYTNGIFNEYYLSDVKDYKDIELEEVIDKHLDFYLDASTTQQSNTPVLKYNNVEITNIPKTSEDKGIKDYIVESTYEQIATGTIQGISDMFDVNVSNIKKSGNASPDFDPVNDKKQIRDRSNSDYNADVLDKIDDPKYTLDHTVRNNIVTITYEHTLKTPIKIDYGYPDEIPIEYQLSPITVKTGYLLVGGGITQSKLYYDEDYVSTHTASSDAIDVYGDSLNNYGKINKYGNVYKTLKQELKDCDILALRFRVYDEVLQGHHSDANMGWGDGNWSNSWEQPFQSKYLEWNGREKPEKGTVLLIYAMLTKSNEVKLFTYTVQVKDTEKSFQWNNTNWYNCWSLSEPKSIKWSNSDRITIPFGIPQESATNDLMTRPFECYYKVTQNLSEGKKVNAWDKIYYYNDYTWKVQINLKYNAVYILNINGVGIVTNNWSYNNPINNLPKNLRYNHSRDITAKYNISNKEYFSNYINNVTSSLTADLIKCPDGIIQNLSDLKRSSLYYYGGSSFDMSTGEVIGEKALIPIACILQDLGKSPAVAGVQGLPESEFEVELDHEYIRLGNVDYKQINTYKLYGTVEKQSVSISDIYSINTPNERKPVER